MPLSRATWPQRSASRSSQGCNSCPPADNLLGELRGKPGVLALTFHVDYWDYLGWKDTLAGPDLSQRQYDYAKARGDMEVFTPQMIVNGTGVLTGNRRVDVDAAIARFARRGAEPTLNVDGGQSRSNI